VRQTLTNMATDHPRYAASYVLPPPQPWARLSTDQPPPWCNCGQCINMSNTKMNVCCGRSPCLTLHHSFHQLALSPDVIEVANILNWSVQFNNEASYDNNIFRNQAYRHVILGCGVIWVRGTDVFLHAVVLYAFDGNTPHPTMCIPATNHSKVI
jgi:hypothetical protein